MCHVMCWPLPPRLPLAAGAGRGRAVGSAVIMFLIQAPPCDISCCYCAFSNQQPALAEERGAVGRAQRARTTHVMHGQGYHTLYHAPTSLPAALQAAFAISRYDIPIPVVFSASANAWHEK